MTLQTLVFLKLLPVLKSNRQTYQQRRIHFWLILITPQTYQLDFEILSICITKMSKDTDDCFILHIIHLFIHLVLSTYFQKQKPSQNLCLLSSFIQTKMSALEQIKNKLQKQNEALTMMDLSEIPIGRITEDIKKVIEKFKKVKVLVLRHCDLDSLDNLPNWKLTAIDLSQNRFKDDIIAKLASITTLTQILLMENSIQSLANLKQLSVLKSLQEVDFTGNPVANEANYRPTLFDSIKSLELVDQRDLNGEFAAEEQEQEQESEFNEGEDGDSEQEQYEEQDQQSSQKPKKGGRRK